MNRKKRGVQPVVATALLVGFAVTVTAVVMMFGTDYVQDIQRKQGTKAELNLGCNGVDFDISGVSRDIEVRNTGSRDIDAFSIIYHGRNSDVRVDHYLLHIPQGSTGNIQKAPAGGGANDITKVDLIPKIQGGPPPIWMSCGAKKTVKV